MKEIRQAVSFLKGAKRKACVFILEHPDLAAFLSIDDLAHKIGVSSSSLTRTATEIGFSGFPEMQRSVQAYLSERLLPTKRLSSSLPQSGAFDFRDSIKKDIRNIEVSVARLTDASFAAAVRLLRECREIHVAGYRTQHASASFFSFILGQLRDGVNLVTIAEGRFIESLERMRKDDLLVCVCLPRYSDFMVKIVEYASGVGCRVLAVTDSETSPIARTADVVISMEYESMSFFNSNVATMAILNALATGVAFEDLEASNRRIARFDAIMSEFSVVHKL